MNNTRKVSIITYHYVRDLKNSKFPKIKGLDLSLFIDQIEYLRKHYHIITMEQVIEAIDNRTSLPSRSILLTFDDGYIEHYLHVFPILKKQKLQGSFFAPAKAVTEHQVLNVNKIHLILASIDTEHVLLEDIFDQLDTYRKAYGLQENDYYFQKLAIANSFDTKEVIFIKRLLQFELAEKLRNILVNFLFRKYVSNDEKAISQQLYMAPNQIADMVQDGMHFGSHGYEHHWLATLPKKEQVFEIDKSLEFLRKIGADISSWTICYPFGSFNEDTISIIKQRGCKLGLTISPDIANLDENDPFTLPRLDTNEIPKHRNADINYWYHKAE